MRSLQSFMSVMGKSRIRSQCQITHRLRNRFKSFSSQTSNHNYKKKTRKFENFKKLGLHVRMVYQTPLKHTKVAKISEMLPCLVLQSTHKVMTTSMCKTLVRDTSMIYRNLQSNHEKFKSSPDQIVRFKVNPLLINKINTRFNHDLKRIVICIYPSLVYMQYYSPISFPRHWLTRASFHLDSIVTDTLV